MHGVDMENKDYVIGIDIGSSSVVMSVGEKLDDGKLKIVGLEVVPVGESTVKDGAIRNFLELGEAIGKAKSNTEGYIGRRLNSAYVGISGKDIYCVRYEDHVFVKDKDGSISNEDVKALKERIDKIPSGNNDEIVARLPLRYRIDDRQYVKNPVGTFGRKLSATYLLVLASKQQIELVKRAMHRAEMSLAGLCITPTILPDILLDKSEMEDGIAIVDIGADLTDIVVMNNGRICYLVSLPIGASTIDADLREFFCVPKDKVEVIKKRCVSVIAEEVTDDLTTSVQIAGRGKKQILQRNIAEIVEERLKDIAAIVAKTLKDAKVSTKIPCGVIITGASAYLADIERLFARELKMEVRLANNIYGLDEESKAQISTYASAASVAIAYYGSQHAACITTKVPSSIGVTHTPQNKENPKEEVGVLNLTNTPSGATTPSVATPKTESQVEETPLVEPMTEKGASLPNPEEVVVVETEGTTPEVVIEDEVKGEGETEVAPATETTPTYQAPTAKKIGGFKRLLRTFNETMNNILNGNGEI